MQSIDLNFNDTEIAFRHKSDKDLGHSKFIFSIFKYPFLVNYGPRLTSLSLKLGLPIKGIVKSTVYRQFCGGETIDECDETVNSLWKRKVGAILDWSVEGHEDEASFETNAEEIRHTIAKAKGKEQYPFCVFKPSGIARVALLEKIDSGKKLDADELDEYYRVKKRFENLGQTAFDSNMRLFIDAEESWIQDSVDNLVNELMEKHNREKAIIFNTVQLYRKGRLDFMRKCIEDARKKGYFLGFKLVRGAYMEKEAARAFKMGYPNPIHDNKANCDKDFDDAIRLCFENADIVSVCAGTHNENSSLLLAQLIAGSDYKKDDPRFWFSQLFGMSDNISFNLAEKGYNVVKYLPYGPIPSVMPYLGRRAKENSSMSGQMGRELTMILQELKRRKKAG